MLVILREIVPALPLLYDLLRIRSRGALQFPTTATNEQAEEAHQGAHKELRD